jgi:peptidoglycan/xylan/chitin deacetylase (PgdA/CDA1 family)
MIYKGKQHNLILYYAEKIISKIPIEIVDKLANITPLIPFYHVVTSERLPHICHLYSYKNERQFISDIDFLCRRYQPVSLPDIIDHVRRGKQLKKCSFLLTFDDGYSQMYSIVAPILAKKGIPAVFFLNTDFLDNRALSCGNKISLLIEHVINNKNAFLKIRPQLPALLRVPHEDFRVRIRSIQYKESRILDELAKQLELNFDEYLTTVKPFLSSEHVLRIIDMGFFIGAHSVDHPHYVDLSLEDQLSQTIVSLQILKRKFNLPLSVFAFPHNDQSVSRRFFKAIESHADMTFGTSGPKIDIIRSNLQRIDFEKTLEPAKAVLTRVLIKKRIMKWIGQSTISRG